MKPHYKDPSAQRKGEKWRLIETAKDQDARMLHLIRSCRYICRTLLDKVVDAGRLQEPLLTFALRWACETMIRNLDEMEAAELEDVKTHAEWAAQEDYLTAEQERKEKVA